MFSKIENEWLSAPQLAAMLGVTTMTIWRWQRDEKLAFPQPSVIHERKYFNRDEINQWMRKTAVGKTAEKVA